MASYLRITSEQKLATLVTILLDDPAMTQALAALKAATTQMSTVAAKMVSATTFIANLASLLTAANKVVSALQSGV